MERQFIRAFAQRAADGKPGDPIRFVASTEGIKRDGMDLRASDWYLENYRKNPVFLWAHDYWGGKLPIGRVEAHVEGNQLISDVVFDQEDEFARSVESKYRRGFLNTVSVGWDFIEIDKRRVMDLLDVSGVPVPGDPDALVMRQYQALKEIVDGGSGGSQNGEDEWERTAAAMAEVFDPASEDPEEARKRRYNSLLPTYRRLGRTAPEWIGLETLRALSADELRGLFLEGEEARLRMGQRTGAVLSKQNLSDLRAAIGMLEQLGTTLSGILARASKDAPAEDDAEEDAEDAPEEDADEERSFQAAEVMLKTLHIQTALMGKR